MKNYIKTLLFALLAIPMAQFGMQLPPNVNDLIVKAAAQGNTTFLQNPAYSGRITIIYDAQNNNLLHIASANGQLEAVKFLCEHRVNKNSKNKQDKSPLDLARANGHNEIVAYLSGPTTSNQVIPQAAPPRLYSNQMPKPVAQQTLPRSLPRPPVAPPAPAVHTQLPGESKSIAPKGLRNGSNGLPNRCFINAATQCLSALSGINNAALAHADKYTDNPLIQNYFKLIQDMQTSREAILDPHEFYLQAWKAIHANPGQQHDSVELVQAILDQLIHPSTRFTNIELQERCTTAVTSTIIDYSTQTMNETIVPLMIPKGAKRIEDCLATLSDIEMVEYDNEQRPKILQLANTSKYLLLGLKRTIYNAQQKKYERNTQPITFPLTSLNIAAYAATDTPHYTLASCIMHVGDANGGHFCAYIKRGNNWYFCDDASVTLVSEKDMQAIANRGYGPTQQYLPIAFFYERV